MNFTQILRQSSFTFALLSLFAFTYGQNPEGPERPEMPQKEPEITIENKAGMQMKPNPDKPNQQIIVYTGQVELIHRPQKMIIQCERLEFFTAPPAQGDAAQDQGMQAEKIIAIGNVIIVKTDETGQEKIARSGRAVYDPNTGTAVLTVAPQIQDEKTWLRAKDSRGVITIRENGLHEAQDGNFETIIREAE